MERLWLDYGSTRTYILGDAATKKCTHVQFFLKKNFYLLHKYDFFPKKLANVIFFL